jgi:hypothetical protein
MRSNLFMSLVVLAGVAGGCAPPSEAETPLAIEPGVVLATFWGEVRDGQVTIHLMEDGADGAALDVVDNSRRQGLVRIREDRNSMPGTAGAGDGIELVVERNAPFTPPGVVVNGCGPGVDSFDVDVTVRNFFSTSLTNVYTEINAINPPGLHSLCNSDTPTPNLLIDGTPLITEHGLVRYGHLAADTNGFATPPVSLIPAPFGPDTTAQTMTWRFRNNGGGFSFQGRVVADICIIDCPPGAIAQEGPLVSINNSFPFVDTNGQVNAILEGPGAIYIGGDFTAVGRATGSAFQTALDAGSLGIATGPWEPFIGGAVHDLVPDDEGGFYAAGSFTQVGHTLAPRLVHILDNGTVDPAFVPPADIRGSGVVTALARDPRTGRLWVGRSAAPFLAVLDPTTGARVGTNPTQPGAAVHDIAIADTVDRVVVVGAFQDLGGNANRDRVAVYNGAAALQNFAVSVDGEVFTVATDGTTAWIGGSFTQVGGQARQNLAALTLANSGARAAWNPGANGPVRALVVSGTTAYIGGAFTNLRGNARNNIGAVASTPTVGSPTLFAWNPNANAQVNAIAIAGADAFIAGAFTTLGGQPRDGLGAVTANQASNTLRPWAPAAAQSTTIAADTRAAIAVDTVGERLLVGGTLRYGGWSRRSRVAAIGMTGAQLGTVLPFATSVGDGAVNALALRDGRLYLGGTFSSVGGVTRRRVAAVNATSGALDTGFVVNIPDILFIITIPSRIEALHVDATHLYLGGLFTQVNSTSRFQLARVDRITGAVDTGYTLQVTGSLFDLIAQSAPPVKSLVGVGDDLYVGGGFTQLGNVAARRLARTSKVGAGSVVTDFNADNVVNSLALSRGVLYAGGTFANVSGQPRARAAAIDLRTHTLSTSFVPTINNTVTGITAAGPVAVVAGSFTTVGGASRPGLAVLDAITGAPFSSQPLSTGTAKAVAFAGGAFVAGLGFDAAGLPVTTAGTVDAPSRRMGLVVVNGD